MYLNSLILVNYTTVCVLYGMDLFQQQLIILFYKYKHQIRANIEHKCDNLSVCVIKANMWSVRKYEKGEVSKLGTV